MFKVTLLITFSLFFSTIFGQKITYKLKMARPQSHYYEVEMIVEGSTSQNLEVKMPVWAPGSYLIREFSKNINLVKAFDEKGSELKVKKNEKNKWTIEKGAAKKVSVKYEVYSFELSVRTSFLDLTHGYISGTGVFMYVE